jgi:hypothetical protein
MTWTVACFCGNLYTAPPDRCDACGSTLSYVVPGDTPTRDTATAGVPSVFAAGASRSADAQLLVGSVDIEDVADAGGYDARTHASHRPG